MTVTIPDLDPASVGLFNTSTHSLRVAGYRGVRDGDRLPALGTEVRPAHTIRFEVARMVDKAHSVIVRVETLDTDGVVRGPGYEVVITTDRLETTRRSVRSLPEFLSHEIRSGYVVIADSPTPVHRAVPRPLSSVWPAGRYASDTRRWVPTGARPV